MRLHQYYSPMVALFARVCNQFPVPNVPRKITVGEIQARFTVDKGWRIRELQTVNS